MRANSPASEPNCLQKTYAQQATATKKPEHRHSCSKFCATADKAESVSSNKGVIDSYEAGRAWWSTSVKLPAKMLSTLQTTVKLSSAASHCRCLEWRHLRRPLRRSWKRSRCMRSRCSNFRKRHVFTFLWNDHSEPLQNSVLLSDEGSVKVPKY